MFTTLKLLLLARVLLGPLAEPPAPAVLKPVPILMYHRMSNRPGRYSITGRDFERQLEDMRRADFFLINLSELLRGDFSRVPPGKRPIVVTFDDSDSGQFRLLHDGRVDPYCAVGILERFRENHPDFGSGAAFFCLAVNPRGTGLFYQPQRRGLLEDFCKRYGLSGKGRGWGNIKLWQAKLLWLVEHGYEVGNHTTTHADLSKLTPEGITREIGICQGLLKEAIGEREGYLWGLCYPFGAVPPGAGEYALCREGDFEGRRYRFDYAVAAWGGMCPHPDTDEFAALRWRIPRIEMHAVRGGGGLDTRWLTRYADSYVKEGRDDPGTNPALALFTSSVEAVAVGLRTLFAPAPHRGLTKGWVSERLRERDRAWSRPIKRLPPWPAYF
ncbi:polysaccharide deacetylase family protein [bacterium]|nr:polysaccharide deacetylase family protein [bacterium]